MINYALAVVEKTPQGIEPIYSEAISCPDFSNWLLVVQEEMDNLHKNGTWDHCDLPKG